MHVGEYRFGDVRPRALFAELFDGEFSVGDGGPLRFDRWSAGVTGVHPADSRAIDESIHLTHQVERRIPDTGLSEQFSVGHCLNRRTRITPADDIVYHYWPYAVSPELQHLPELVEATEHLPAQTRGTTLMRHAFRPPAHRRARQRARRVLEAAGVLARAPRFSL